MRGRAVAACLVAGGLLALSIPPWGWWPLAFVGIAVVAVTTRDLEARARWWAGGALGVGMFVPGLWWMGEFHALGAILVVVLETAFVAGAIAATPSGPWRTLGLPAALVLAEAARATFPFGGLPMAGVPLGQVDGPLAPMARVGGELLLLWGAAALGAAAADVVRRRTRPAALGALAVVVAAAAGTVAPDGGPPVDRLTVALVQGGGARGFRAVDTDPEVVFDNHLTTSLRIQPPVDLVLWPEDVVDVTERITSTPEGVTLAGLADKLDTTLVVGVVEDVGTDRFANAAVAWGPNGRVLDRYDKVRRVPFGEYVPGRNLIEKVADLSAIPRDAVAGSGPGLLRTPAGDLGVLISYEVFFADRARGATDAGGSLLVVPTNAASYTTSQVPTAEVAAARLRAIENGRDLVQAAPTGYSAVIDHLGRVHRRSTLGERQVVRSTVSLRRGRTIYTRTGEVPVVVLAGLALALSWWRRRAT